VCVWSTPHAWESERLVVTHFPTHSCRPSDILMVHAMCGTQTVSISASLRDSGDAEC